MKKYKNRKDTAKMVVAILGVACMLTACGNTEADAVEEIAEAVTETATEPAEVLPTETPAAEPTKAPAKTVDEGSATEPVEPVAVTAEPDTKPSAEPVAASAGAAAEAGYTCTEMTQTMYAKSAVNVRDLPGTEGQKIGGLQAGQEIAVTGKCDQTGWYRFDLNGTTAYVSDKYIVSEKPAQTAAANGSGKTTQSTAAATGSTTATTGDAATTSGEYFDRTMAEQVFAMVNEERVANGINALIWSEDLYNLAVQRCYENDIHESVRPGTGENYSNNQQTAEEIYQGWHDSPGHHDNYMNPSYTYSAVAVRIIPILGGALGNEHIHYQVFTREDATAEGAAASVNQEPPIATKTPNDGTSTGTANVGWSLTPPMQEDGLKNWQEQNPDAEVSFGN